MLGGAHAAAGRVQEARRAAAGTTAGTAAAYRRGCAERRDSGRGGRPVVLPPLTFRLPSGRPQRCWPRPTAAPGRGVPGATPRPTAAGAGRSAERRVGQEGVST